MKNYDVKMTSEEYWEWFIQKYEKYFGQPPSEDNRKYILEDIRSQFTDRKDRFLSMFKEEMDRERDKLAWVKKQGGRKFREAL